MGDVVDRLCATSTRIVTLTVIEKGYFLSPAEGRLLHEDPAIAADTEQPAAPCTALRCDNMPDNGRRTRAVVTQLAACRDPALARWIEQEVAFPGSMVDRIVPATTAADRERLAELGVDAPNAVVCYNFTPVLDWTRTDLAYRLPDGGLALRFDQTAFAAFDLFLLERPGAGQEYDDAEKQAARHNLDGLTLAQRERLVNNVIAGLPGAEEHYTLERFREVLAAYADIDGERLREHLGYFLNAIIPVADEVGVRMAIHPDDPPRPMFGLPRVVSGPEDVQWLFDVAPGPANGLTLCSATYGLRPDVDVAGMTRRFVACIYFAHLRPTQRESPDPRSFHEAHPPGRGHGHGGHHAALVAEEWRREREGGPRLPLRPDHGHHILDDQRRDTRAGYPLYGRLKGLAELRGVDCRHLHADAMYPTGLMFKERAEAGADPRTEYFRRGSAASHLSPADAVGVDFAAARHLHATGIPPAVSASCRELSWHMLDQARAAGASISFDPNLRPGLWRSEVEMRDTLNAMAARSDWVLPGLAEGQRLTGRETPQDIAGFYLDRGARAVFIKLGPEGGYYRGEFNGGGEQSGTVAGFPVVEVVDTVGAGDGFAVGVISALLDGVAPRAALRRGNLVGAEAVRVIGDMEGLPGRERLHALEAGYGDANTSIVSDDA